MLNGKPPGAGKSSFDLIDHSALFREIELTKTTVFLDLGCGIGDYVIAAAEIIGPEGEIYGIDAWEEAVSELREKVIVRGLKNVKALLADVTEHIPLPDHSADVCLMAAVLHDFKREGGAEGVLREAARVLRPGGLLAVVEFKKVDNPTGPPIHIRLSSEKVEGMIAPFKFVKKNISEAGPFLYILTALKKG